MPEWPKGADCKFAGLRLRRFESFSIHHAHLAQLVEHVLGKDEVVRSIRIVGSIFYTLHLLSDAVV
jgi:hypothetical protein